MNRRPSRKPLGAGLAALALLAAACVTPLTQEDVETRLERAAEPLVGRQIRVYPIWAETPMVAFGLLHEARSQPDKGLSLRVGRAIELAAKRGRSVVVGGPHPELSDRVLLNALELNRERRLPRVKVVLVSESPPSAALARAARDLRVQLYHREF